MNPTVGRLIAIYLDEVTPSKSVKVQAHDRFCVRMFSAFFPNRDPMTLSRRDWDRFVRLRRAGQIGSGRSVGNRAVEHDLKWLMAVLNWAVQSKLIPSNPLKGCKTPRITNVTRVFLTQDEYRAMLDVSLDVDWRFHVALVLAHETGHRIGAIRKLEWADVDLDVASILWRAENDKTGHQHRTPLTPAAVDALEFADDCTVNEFVFPADDPKRRCGASRFHDWWYRAEALAGLERKPRRGWHSLRRKFASDLMEQPMKVLCELGGWRKADTILRCYQRADQDRMRSALENRR